tara:strand:- start:6484 stop:9723 length:3240 start_codon:yes stop_codon:yes gene_type:complete
MADFILKPPTQQDMQERQLDDEFGGFTKPFTLEVDPKDQTPPVPITATAEKLPARLKEKPETSVEKIGSAMENSALFGIVEGFNNLILALPDTAINAVASGLEAAGLVEEGTVDRDVLLRTFNSGSFEQRKTLIPYLLSYGVGERIGSPEGDTLRQLAEGGGEGLAAAVPFIGLTGKAAQGSAAAGNVIGQLSKKKADDILAGGGTLKDKIGAVGTTVKESLLAPFVAAPGATVATEAALGGLSGVGIEGEKQAFGTETGIGGLVLPLSGPALYYAGKGALTKGPIGFVLRKGKQFTTDRLDDAAVLSGRTDPSQGKRGEVAQGQISNELQAGILANRDKINAASEIEDRIGVYGPIQLSPAEQTMDAPLLATQARAERTGDAGFTRQNLDRKTTALQSIERFKNAELTGNAIEDAPLFVFNRATGKYEGMIAPIDDAADDVTFQLNLLANADTGAYPKLTDKGEVGASIRDTILNAQTKAKQSAEKLAKRLNINNADQLASRDATAAAKEAVRSSLVTRQGEQALSYEGLPKLVKNFIESPLDRISFQDWKNFRDQVGAAIGAASAQGNKADVRALAILSNQLDDLGAAYGRTNAKFEEFRTWYDTNVITPFERSGVIQITSRGPGTTKTKPVYYIADENVASSFLQDTNTASQFMRLFGDDPQQLRNIKAVVMDDIRAKAYDESKGTFRIESINKYLNNNRETLEVLGLADDLADSQQLINSQLQRQAELAARRKAITQNKVFQAIARSQQRNDPEKLIDEALGNPTLMKELRTLTNAGLEGIEAEEAANAFRSAVMQRLLKRAPDAIERPAAFKQFLVDNERILDAGFDKSHIDNMYLIADAYERVMATGLPMGAGVTPEDIVTRLTGKLGTTPAGISNRFIAVQEGRLGAKAAAGYILSRAVRQQSSIRADALFRQMMFDPTIAKTMTAKVPESAADLSISAPLGRRLNIFMFTNGLGYNDYVPGSTTDEPLIKFELEPSVGPRQGEEPEENNSPNLDFKLFKEEMPVPPLNKNQPNLQPVDNSTSIIEKISAPPMPKNTQPQIDARTLFPNDPLAGAIQQAQANTGIMSLPRRA